MLPVAELHLHIEGTLEPELLVRLAARNGVALPTTDPEELVAKLRDRQTALTVCPLSNVALRVVDNLSQHPLPAMLEGGLLACVNSDDPAYFGGYVDDNLAAVRAAFGFDDAALAGLARNSFDACFAPAVDKARWKAEVDAWLDP